MSVTTQRLRYKAHVAQVRCIPGRLQWASVEGLGSRLSRLCTLKWLLAYAFTCVPGATACPVAVTTTAPPIGQGLPTVVRGVGGREDLH